MAHPPRHNHVQLPPVWQQQRAVPVSHLRHSGAHCPEIRAWPSGVSRCDGMGGQHHVLVPSVLPPAEEEWEEGWEEKAAPAAGRDPAPDHCAWPHAPAGFEDQGADVRSAADAWQQLLQELRSDPCAAGGPAAADAQPVVGAQPSDGVLLAQGHGEAAAQVRGLSAHLWVVNTCDWIDVEHVLRKMLCWEASDCYLFHSTGYVFFRSCAMMHVVCPSEFLRAGVLYRFPGTEVVVEILRAHPEGVLEVGCYLEYAP